MTEIKRLLTELRGKTLGRIRRAEVLTENLPEMNRAEIDAMINSQIAYLMEWSKADIIKEFCDPEELLMREILRRMGE